MDDEITKIAVADFEKKPDGSWVSVNNSDAQSRTGKIIRIAPGMVFKRGGLLSGLDIAEALDKASAS